MTTFIKSQLASLHFNIHKSLSNYPKYLQLWSKETSSRIIAILVSGKQMHGDSVLLFSKACRLFSVAINFIFGLFQNRFSSRDIGTKKLPYAKPTKSFVLARIPCFLLRRGERSRGIKNRQLSPLGSETSIVTGGLVLHIYSLFIQFNDIGSTATTPQLKLR